MAARSPGRMAAGSSQTTYISCGVRDKIPMSVKKTLLPRKDAKKHWLSKHQIMGWRAVSAAGLQGKGGHERSACFFTDTGLSARLLAG